MAVSTSRSNKLKDEVYKAAVDHAGKNDNKEIILKFYEENPTSPIDDQGDTVLHVLALHRTEVACELLQLEMHHGLLAKNCKGNTALHEASRVGALKLAKLMVRKENSIVDHSNLVGETPLYWAAAYGQTKMFQFLAEKSNHSNLMGLRRNDGLTILHAAVMGEFYDLAKEIVDRYPPFLAVACNEEKKTALHLLAQSPFLFRSGTLYSEMNVADSSFIPLALLKLMIYSCLSIPVEDPNKGNLTDPEDSREPEDGRSSIKGKKRNYFSTSNC
ncbi:ankyrin repeat and sterile alpha motif domain-containing protein 1B-like [Macadamia integrifolia]|uniref:ankyrin repeat and sterile alpha motif domain-containing protein 1B-like n=1 Tax=Macadamia integrifolia TaxID=60698 RepID=UPI001C4E3141|nr:ankyrin repeat and sterile alpha motif domain-containing protein 1B-like [Macadamia integrifolia]